MAIFKCLNKKGKYMDDAARENVINYILKDNKIVSGFSDMIMVDYEDPAKSMTEVADFHNKDNGVRLRHFVISFDREELSDPRIANLIGREIMYYIGNTFQCVYAVHEDTDNINLHVVFNSVSYNLGKRFGGTYQQFYGLQKLFHRVLCSYGIYKLYYVSNI